VFRRRQRLSGPGPQPCLLVRLGFVRGSDSQRERTHGGLTRSEFEYEIPLIDAEFMLKEFCSNHFLEKIRHLIKFDDLVWEVDEYSGPQRGLVLAEVELSDATQQVQLPSWLGKEVTDDPRFRNAYLAANPQFWRDQ
jgi:adenylate cyclase